MKRLLRLAAVCGFASLAASLPANADASDGTDVLDERVAALVELSAPAEGSSTPTPPKKEGKKAKKKTGGKKGKKKKGKKKRKSSKAKRKASDGGEGRKTVLEEDFLVEGKLEKPNAYYILRRSQAGYDWARLDAKFLPLVLESVQDPLF